MTDDTIWSTEVQSIGQLDNTREIKFRENHKDLYLSIMNLKPGMTIVDMGCGPGTLTRKLAGWLGPSTRIIGIDRDVNFLNYARAKALKSGLNNQLEYIEGDVLNVPLYDNSVDATTSHTVIEHVPNERFLKEQMRICKPGGRVSIQNVRTEAKIITKPNNSPEVTKREIELWNIIDPFFEKVKKLHRVGEYNPDPLGLPKLFEKLGFVNIQLDVINFSIVIDDDRNTFEEKKLMIEVESEEVKDSAVNGFRLANGIMSGDELKELLELIAARYKKRMEILLSGKKLWDYEISPLLIVSGEKPVLSPKK